MNKLLELIQKQFKDSDLLTEDVKTEINTIVQSSINEAVEAKVKEKAVVMQETYDTKLQNVIEEGQEALNEYTEGITNKIDSYLTEVVNEYLELNEIAIASGEKVVRAENLIDGVKTLLKDNNIEVSEEENDMLKSTEDKVVVLQESLDKKVKDNAEKDKQIFEFEKAIAVNKLTSGLTDVETQKVLENYDGIVSNTIEDFEKHITLIIEKTLTSKKDENEDEDELVETLTRDGKKKPGVYNTEVDKYLN